MGIDAIGKYEARSHVRAVGWVAAGGFLGTVARFLLVEVVPDWRGVPVAILVINLLGAFLLGLVIEALAQSGPDIGIRRSLRLFVGTGIIGGFTTYSALAMDTAALLHDGRGVTAAFYGLGSVVVGVLMSAAGIWLARVLPIPRRPEAGV